MLYDLLWQNESGDDKRYFYIKKKKIKYTNKYGDGKLFKKQPADCVSTFCWYPIFFSVPHTIKQE